MRYPSLSKKLRRYNAQGIGVASLLIQPSSTTLLLWDVGHREECPMSETDQYWQYAREAILSVGYATNDEERRDLLELARTWTQAAMQERTRPIVDRPIEVASA